jgi:ATP-dependent Clp protease ATP-binding subunit ClpC
MGGEQPALALTPRVQRIMAEAQRIAREAGHDYIGTEHLQLGIIAIGGGVASDVLNQLGQADAIRDKIKEVMSSDGYNTPTD